MAEVKVNVVEAPVPDETTPLFSPKGAEKALESVKAATAKSFEEIKSNTAKSFEEIKGHTAVLSQNLATNTAKSFEEIKGHTVKFSENVHTNTSRSIEEVKQFSVKQYHAAEVVAAKVFSEENKARAMDFTKGATDDLKKQTQEGDFSIRMFANLAGFCLVVKSFFGFFYLFFSFHLFQAILEVYTLALGLIMIALESRGFLRQNVPEEHKPLLEFVYSTVFQYAYLLQFVWGRGGMYFMAGCLQLAQSKVSDVVVGGFVMCVGVLYILVGRATARNLAKLRSSLSSQTIKEKFDEADVDGTGELSRENFSTLCDQLDLHLNRRQAELAFLCMDKDDKGTVSFEEFQAWWADWEEAKEIV